MGFKVRVKKRNIENRRFNLFKQVFIPNLEAFKVPSNDNIQLIAYRQNS